MSGTTRREFLKTAAAGVCAAGLLPIDQAFGDMEVPTRPFGRTGENLSVLSIGGSDLASIRDQNEYNRLLRTAIDRGLTFMDNAWEYARGRAEEMMGKALEDGYRDKVFLMTKHHGRDKKTAQQHLEDSLRRLKTDVIDLWQFHEVVYPKDPELIFSQGAIEAALEAKEAGKIRYIGFTGHKHPDIHKDMLDRFEWDAVQMPMNVMDAHFRSFEKEILPILKERQIGVIAMKSLGARNVLKADVCSVEEAIHYVLSQPIDTLVLGIRNLEQLEMDIRLANKAPMSKEDQQRLLARTKEAALTGKYEPFKTTRNFDGPLGRKIHGIPLDA